MWPELLELVEKWRKEAQEYYASGIACDCDEAGWQALRRTSDELSALAPLLARKIEEARLEFIKKVCADICPYCADPKAGLPELHEGRYHTEAGVSPGYRNEKCYAADLRARMQRIAELEAS